MKAQVGIKLPDALRPTARQPLREMSFSELREENRDLRELVVQLSKIIVTRTLER